MNRIKGAVLLCVLAWLAQILSAQAMASLHGQIVDPSNAAVPQANVTLTGPNGLVKVAVTDNTGSYTILGLPAGTYTAHASATGFSLYEKAGIELSAGRASTLDVKLALAAAETQQVTVADSQQVELDPSKNAGALVLKGEDLDMLSDDPDELQSDLQALAGPATGPNGGQIFVDGFSNGQLPPKDSIREIRINSNPFAAEFERMGFGRIEIFTKPGTDKFRGTAFVEADTGALDARNPFSTIKPSFLTRQFQGNLSGPLSKKASFFIDFNYRNQDENALVNATTLNSSFVPIPFIESVAIPATRTSISPRIDYQLTPNVTLQARYTLTKLDQQNNGVGGFNLTTQGIQNNNTNQSAQLTETWVVNARTINETRFQYTHTSTSQGGTSLVPTISVAGAFTGGSSLIGTAFDHQNSYELQNYTSMTRGTHLLKAGIRIRGTEDTNRSDSNFNGTFNFASINAYAITAQGLAQGLPLSTILANGGGAFQYTITAGNPLVQVNQIDIAPYIQDDWRVKPSFTLSLGLRYEVQTNIGDKGNFAPRVGLAWGIGGGQGRLRQPKTVIRAGFGIFYDRFLLGQVLNAERLNGTTQQRLVLQNPNFVCVLTVPCAGIPSASQLVSTQAITTYQIDPNLVAPRMIQTAIGFDRQLPKNITVSMNYTNARGQHELFTRNINAPLPGSFQTGAPIYPSGTPNPIDQYESGGVFKQNQLITNVNARLNAKYQLFGFYAYGHAHSNTDGIGTFPSNTYDLSTEWSRAQFDIRHRFLIGGNIAAPLGIRFAPMILYNSAAPFNIILGQDLNGDGQNTDRPSFATAADVANCTSNPKACTVVPTAYGLLNTRLTPGETLVPRNYGEGFGSLNVNLRISRTWGFGETTSGPANNGGRRGGPGGAGGRGGPGGPVFIGGPGGGGPPAGGPPPGGGFFGGGGAANRRYSLTASIEVRNLLNSVNPGQPVGVLSSPLFGEAQGVAGGGFGPGGGGGGIPAQTANRRLEMQLRFTF